MSNTMTAIFIDTCPKCDTKQTALVGYLSHCLKCGHDWRSYRNIKEQPVIGWHDWWISSCDESEGTIYNDFVSQLMEVGK